MGSKVLCNEAYNLHDRQTVSCFLLYAIDYSLSCFRDTYNSL